MTYFQGSRQDLATMVKLLPKHNTDHSPLRRHTTVYAVDVAEDGKTATAISSFVVYQNLLDGVNSHIDAGESRLSWSVATSIRSGSSTIGPVSSNGKCVSTTAGSTRGRTGRSEQRGASRFPAHGRKCRCCEWRGSRKSRHERGVMSWKRVCKVTDVPENGLRKFTVDGVALVIANYGSGFRAIPPLCPHLEEPLEESGVIADCALTCTKHLWSWDLNSLAMLGETERPLKTYEVKLENDDVLAFIDKELVYEFEDEDDMADDDFFSKA